MQIDNRIIDDLIIESAKQGNEISLWVATNSMAPLIVAGDRIIVQSIKEGARFRIGDIVLFRVNGELFLVHRIIGHRSIEGVRHVRQKGDASIGSHFLPVDSIVGSVRLVKKQNRTIDLTTKTWRLLNLIIGLVVGYIDLVARIYRYAVRLLPVPGVLITFARLVKRGIDRLLQRGIKALLGKNSVHKQAN